MLANKGGKPRKYWFAEMNVGDQHFYPAQDKCINKYRNLLFTAAAGQVGSRGKFKSRTVQKGGVIGVKIERIAQ